MKTALAQDSIQLEKIQIKESRDLIDTFILKSSEILQLKKEYLFEKEDLSSEIIFRAVIPKDSVFEFYPKIKIKKGAKNTNTKLSIKCLLLDESSKAIVEPAMEIEEDNVKAGHGASIGYISDSDLYYLRSRGINKKEAIDLIIEAFIIN